MTPPRRTEPAWATAIHPVHAVLLAGAFPLFLGAALSDAAYGKTYEIQWSNFASWLIAGGLVFAGLALVWALVDLLRPRRRASGGAVYAAVMGAVFVLGFYNALVHARDAWAVMPAGLVLSVVVTVLAAVAIGLGFRATAGDIQ
jgi:uncharacterized membrane protein